MHLDVFLETKYVKCLSIHQSSFSASDLSYRHTLQWAWWCFIEKDKTRYIYVRAYRNYWCEFKENLPVLVGRSEKPLMVQKPTASRKLHKKKHSMCTDTHIHTRQTDWEISWEQRVQSGQWQRHVHNEYRLLRLNK